MALCSSTAYRAPEDATAIFTAAGFDRVIFIERGDTQSYLAHHPNNGSPFAVLAFRGTESRNDLWVDARIIKRPAFCLAKRVHRGFDDAFGLVWGENIENEPGIYSNQTSSIRHALHSMLKEVGAFDLYLTGHSLGGALAQLAGMHLLKDEDAITLEAIINFGSPRVGNGKHVRHVEKLVPILRIVNGADTVARKPPTAFGYQHAGTEYWLRRDGNDFIIEPTASLARKIRWVSLAYDNFHSFLLYLFLPPMTALLLTKFSYDALDLNLSPGHALGIGAMIWILMLLLAFRIAPLVNSQISFWLNRGLKSGTDHFIANYIKQIAIRAEKCKVSRPNTEKL